MKNMMAAAAIVLASAVGSLAWAAADFPGNGATGFGGSVGTGSLAVSDSASDLTFTLNRGSGTHDNVLVVYLDTKTGGFASNVGFTDNGDGGRTAISGVNNGNPSIALVTMPLGFDADYAMAIENGFIGVFELAAGASHTFLFGQGQSGDNNAASYSITLGPAEMALIGLTPNSGQTFGLVGSLISTSAYRSNETIGPSITVPGSPGDAPNAGFNGTQAFSQTQVYTLVPEPASAAGLLAGMGWIAARRRRRA